MVFLSIAIVSLNNAIVLPNNAMVTPNNAMISPPNHLNSLLKMNMQYCWSEMLKMKILFLDQTDSGLCVPSLLQFFI